MTCIVQKYGGSSVADVNKLHKIARLIAGIKEQNFDIVVVVSAMGKTTDELVRMAREISPKPPRREMDMLLSTGERITMSLLSMALHERGLRAVSLTGSQAGTIIGVQAVVSEKQVERIRLHGEDARALFKQAAEFLESEQVPVKEVNVTGIATAGKHSKASL